MIAKICQRKSIITWKVKEKWLNENFFFSLIRLLLSDSLNFWIMNLSLES